MSIPTVAQRRKQWSSPPVDDVGYLPSKDLLQYSDEGLRELIQTMERVRYTGWRNYRNNWRSVLKLDQTENKNVLDYGCGVGIEALQYAKTGNRVTIVDLAPDNVLLAQRVLQVMGYEAEWAVGLMDTPPFFYPNEPFDVIHCCGVLHHIPDAVTVVEEMFSWLKPGGELRLMVYSDEAWRIATKTEPPEGDVFDYVEFDKFWKHWDAVGGYADWYDQAKLEARFGKWFQVERCRPLTQHREYLGAILLKR